MTYYENFEEFIMSASRPISNGSNLLIVCNTKNKTSISNDYSNFKVNTEYLNDNEEQEIMDLAYKLNLPFNIFYNERDFMKFIINKINDIDLNKIIVYNSAQSGIGAGRKSLIPAFCKYFNMRITGSDSYRVSLCRDKFSIYSILNSLQIPVPKSVLFENNSTINLEDGLKYIAKPLYESSSIGIDSRNIFLGSNIPYEHLNKLSETLNQPLIIQEFKYGYEVEIPILCNNKKFFCLEPVCLHKNKENRIMGNDILSYTEIYDDKYYFSPLPQSFDLKKLKQVAVNVANLLSLNGLCRVDFRVNSASEFWITDVSTNPHFISHSSVAHSMKLTGINKNILELILLLS